MLYVTLLFVHIVFAVMVFAAMALDTVALTGLRSATTAREARPWVRVLHVSALGVWARFGVLFAGAYLAWDRWSWQGWIIVALVSWVVLVLLGEGLTGRKLRELTAIVQNDSDSLSPALAGALHLDRVWLRILARWGLGIGIVYDMTVKPPLEVGFGVVIAGLLLGAAASRWPGLSSWATNPLESVRETLI